MKKTIRLFGIFTLILLTGLVLAVCHNSSGGRGEDEEGGGGDRDGLSETTAFLVKNATELRYVGRGKLNPAGYKNWGGEVYYKQTTDIDLGGIANWTPIYDYDYANAYDGIAVTTADAVLSAWWTTSGNWDTSYPWDWTNTWNLPSDGKLPTLRIMRGEQNPVIK